MKDLSIILILYDRGGFYHYPKRWMNYASKYLSNYKILIADGSGNSEIKNMFKDKSNFKNLDYNYYEYKKDQSYGDYFAKLANILTKVDTEFSMLTDDDDFLSNDSINHSINFLKKNINYSTSGGIIGSFHLIERDKLDVNKYTLPKFSNSIINETAYDRIMKPYIFHYPHTFYDVHRSGFQKKNFKILDENNFKEITMVEMLTEALDVIDGKIHRHNQLFGMRQLNFNNSSHKQFINEKGSIVNRAIFGELSQDCKKWLNIISEKISVNDNIDYEKVKKEVAEAYVKNIEYYLYNPKIKRNHNQFKKYVPNFIKSLKRRFEDSLKHNSKKSVFFDNEFLVNIYNHFK